MLKLVFTGVAAAIRSASSLVRVIGCSRLRSTMARAMRFEALFAVGFQHKRNVCFFRALQPLGCRLTARRIHTHIQRPVAHKGETALGVIQLRRRDAKSSSTPSILPVSPRSSTYLASAENGPCTIENVDLLSQRLRLSDRGRSPVTVRARQAATGSGVSDRRDQRCRQYKCRLPDIKAVNRLIQQHRGVFKIFLHSYSDKSCNRSDKGS